MFFEVRETVVNPYRGPGSVSPVKTHILKDEQKASTMLGEVVAL